MSAEITVAINEYASRGGTKIDQIKDSLTGMYSETIESLDSLKRLIFIACLDIGLATIASLSKDADDSTFQSSILVGIAVTTIFTICNGIQIFEHGIKSVREENDLLDLWILDKTNKYYNQ